MNNSGIGHIAQLTSLRVLLLPSSSDLTNDGVAKLVALEDLRTLRLGGAKLTSAIFGDLKKLSNLEHLEIISPNVDGRELLQIGALSNLKTLRVGRTAITSRDVISLRKQLPNVDAGFTRRRP
jgi:hypothetical protein